MHGPLEWVGARVTLPVYITEGEPYRPDAIIWLERPSDLIIDWMLLDPTKAVPSFADTLRGPDRPLPALGGKTAREAVRTRTGRERVDALLKDIEHREALLPAAERFDVSVLRRALDL